MKDTSDAERQAAFLDWLDRAAFPDWLDRHNCHRPHTSIGGQTPSGRVTNLSGQRA